MKNNKLIIGILLGGIVIVILIFSLFVYWDNKNSEQIVLNIDNRELYSIMLEQTRGLEDYLESAEVTWPTDGYKFNAKNSGCVDKDGNLLANSITYDIEKNMVIAKGKEINYCYVYFDIY